jgi:protein-tyrosine kinase
VSDSQRKGAGPNDHSADDLPGPRESTHQIVDVVHDAKSRARRDAASLVPRARVPLQPAPLTVRDAPSGMANDAQVDRFRQLRTVLLSMGDALGLYRFTTLVVPLTSGAGGSFVARNLAAAFTLQDGQAAMLVDCNPDRPVQHLALNVPAERGLFDVLDDPNGPTEGLLRSTPIHGLHLIPAGAPRSRFREWFSSAAMHKLMETTRQGEHFVFLDGPPVKGSPDARILSELADFIVLVVGYGAATADEISEAAASFAPSKFAGVVFNERG